MRNKSRTTFLILQNIIHISISAADRVLCMRVFHLALARVTRLRFGSMSAIKMHIISNHIEFIQTIRIYSDSFVCSLSPCHARIHLIGCAYEVLLRPLALIFMPIKNCICHWGHPALSMCQPIL